MENREFYLRKDGIDLHCKLDFPAGAREKLPLVILQHGLTGHMEERHIIGFKDTLLETGCAVLRTELYGHGKSGGAFKDHTVWEWVSEMLFIIQEARRWEFVTDMYLGGHSQGGLTALLAGGMARDCLKALLLLAPAVVIRDACRAGSLFGAVIDVNDIPDETEFNGRVYGGNYFRTGAFLPVEACVDAFTGPVLIVHGDADEAVPYSYAEQLHARYADSVLATVPNDSHCYDHHLDIAEAAVKDFMTAQLNK